MLSGLDALSIIYFHDRKLAEPDWPLSWQDNSSSGVWYWIARNHRCNTLLWSEEDKARRTNVEPAEIAAGKRRIDRYNQERNDAVEAMDEAILAALDGCRPAHDARLNSETAGAMIDRLSILCLKIHHMRKQTHRVDVDATHIAACSAKLERLMLQREDLGSCLDRLLTEAVAGRAYFKVYRQFKAYNDPALNPYLDGRRAPAAGKEAS